MMSVHSIPYVRILLAGCTALMFQSCANQIPPAGGPVDTSGPQVTYVFPEPYSLNVSTDHIEIEFDEYVDKRSAMESIFISPPIDDLEYDWWGTSVEISFPGPLRENTTYLVTVGTDVTDLEPSRKNRMESAFSFPFATGNTIDRGFIFGTVLPIAPEDEMGGVMVYAYAIPTGRADTLNVHHASPSYVTQAGRNGSFALPHIRIGPYFILSIRDASRNIVYDTEEDEFAVPVAPVRLSRLDTASTHLVLQLAKEDTTAPRITEVSPIDRNHLRVDFSEPIDTSRARRPVATLEDTLTDAPVTVYAVVPVLPSMNQAVLTTDFQKPESVYRLMMSGLFDPVGNEAQTSSTRRIFTSSTTVDSLPPALSGVSVKDSAEDVSVRPDVIYTFSEPVGTEQWSPARVQLVSLGEKSEVPVETRWLTESVLGIRPAWELGSFAWYELKVMLHGLRDWKLDDLRDSVSIVHFRTEDVYDSGTIEGTVMVRSSVDTSGPVYVTARSIGVEGAPDRTAASLPDGRFIVRRLRPGMYTLDAYKDRNGNGTFDPGLPYPYRPAERRSLWSDTLKVRSRWPLEGMRIVIP